MVSKEEIKRISHSDPETIEVFITSLVTKLEQMETKIKELERKLGQNSQNSNWPPSRDIKRKPMNNRTSGGKKGAPLGHPGHTLPFSPTPDQIITYPVSVCNHCATSLAEVASIRYERRQVFEIPQPVITVTEHRAEHKRCPCCRRLQKAAFPKDVTAGVQYGSRFTVLSAYLHTYQLLPLSRMADLFHVLTGCKPSEGTLLARISTMAQRLEPYVETIRQSLLTSPVIHSDETGVHVDKQEHWVHVASTEMLTLLNVHPSRGSEGMKAMEVLPLFKGTVMHDCYGPYMKRDEDFQFQHALCNAHLSRECKGIVAYDKHRWAGEMLLLLRDSWKATRGARKSNIPLTEETIQAYESRYDDILQEGQAEWEKDPVPEKKGPQGRLGKSKAANLWHRFRDHKAIILGYLRNPDLPFDNNQAERDLRMVAVKRKVSGCFRSDLSPHLFATIRSFISTLLKQERPVLASLELAYSGTFTFHIQGA
ncbi:MAG: IS66 family transposase [Gorillibacterium sp.]|nr:IS66 family transposase [Gorillibacterium sp.]